HRELADLGLRVFGQVALVLVEHRTERPDLTPDPRRITGQVHHRAHQRRDAHALERGGDRRVVVIEGKTRVRVVFSHSNRPDGRSWSPGTRKSPTKLRTLALSSASTASPGTVTIDSTMRMTHSAARAMSISARISPRSRAAARYGCQNCAMPGRSSRKP